MMIRRKTDNPPPTITTMREAWERGVFDPNMPDKFVSEQRRSLNLIPLHPRTLMERDAEDRFVEEVRRNNLRTEERMLSTTDGQGSFAAWLEDGKRKGMVELHPNGVELAGLKAMYKERFGD